MQLSKRLCKVLYLGLSAVMVTSLSTGLLSSNASASHVKYYRNRMIRVLHHHRRHHVRKHVRRYAKRHNKRRTHRTKRSHKRRKGLTKHQRLQRRRARYLKGKLSKLSAQRQRILNSNMSNKHKRQAYRKWRRSATHYTKLAYRWRLVSHADYNRAMGMLYI